MIAQAVHSCSPATHAVSRHCGGRRAWLLLAACALSGALPAAAQPSPHVRELGEFSIKELMQVEVDSVYGASRYLQKTMEAPSSITVVGADEIRQFGARTLGDVLGAVRGVYVPDDRNYSYLGIRGFDRPGDYNTRVLVLIDGHRMNDNVYDQGDIGREGMVDIDLIDHVEVIRGPSSSVYGSSAFFGVVNVVTKHVGATEGLRATAEVGSFDSYKAGVTYGTSLPNGLEWLISATHYESGGEPSLYFPEFDQRLSSDPRAAHDGIARNLDGESADNFFGSVRWGEFSFAAFASSRTKHVPTASFGAVFGDDREFTIDERSYVDARYDHAFRDGLSVQARAFYDVYRYSGAYPYDLAEVGSPPDIAVWRDTVLGRWVGTEVQLTAHVFARHTVVVGGEYRDNIDEKQTAYYDLEPRDYLLFSDRSSDTLGLFAQSQTMIRDDLQLTVGARFDRYSGSVGSTWNPRLALIYNPSSTSALKALYGEAFRAPNPYEQYYYEEQPNYPALEPETIRTSELAYEKHLSDQYRLTVTGYRYRVHNLVTQTATPADDIYFANIDGASAKGIEIEIERQFAAGGVLRASYGLQEALDASGEPLSSSPRHLAKLHLRLPFDANRLSAGIEMQYHGAALTLRGNRVDDFVTTNFTLYGRPVKAGLETSVTIYNVFDTRYGYPGAEDHLQDVLMRDGRTLLGKLTYRF